MHAGLGWGFKDVFIVAGSITVSVLLSRACTRACVLNYFYFILPTPSPRSLGPKHTLVRETAFHWELLAPQTTETFHCQEGIWPCHTAVPPPLLPVRGRHPQFPFGFLGFFSPPPPSRPTKESNQAMVAATATAQTIVHNRQAITSGLLRTRHINPGVHNAGRTSHAHRRFCRTRTAMGISAVWFEVIIFLSY